jgi:hypothetical protein
MITDRITADAQWLKHEGGTFDIGGVAFAGSSLTPLPSGGLLLSQGGNAAPGPNNYPCTMWYCPRPIYSKTGCTMPFSFRFGSTAPAAMNAMEVDRMYAMTCSDGKVRLFPGSTQWVPGIGWMIVNAAGDWVPTGYNPSYLVGKKYHVKIVHAWDLVNNTMSVVSIDGFAVPAGLQRVAAAVTNWAPGFVNVQLQPSSKPAGLAWDVTIGRKIDLQWE